MKIRSSLSIILMLSTFAPAPGQSTTPSPPAPSTVLQQTQDKSGGEDDVVRITSNLVQVDAVVTDSKGRLVTDLTAEDFEILEDNRPQKITNLSFVSNETKIAQPLPSAAPRGKDAPPIPPVRLRPEQVRRTIALVVDDLGISFESIGFVRKALRKFIDEQMQPDDLVAIIRTSAGMGALQQFTSDKRQLYAAIERVRWNPMGRSGTSAFAPIESNPLTRNSPDTAESADPNGDEDVPNQGVDPENTDDRHLGDELEQFRQDVFTVGTLGAVNYVVRGLGELPGRKSILLITDGLKLFERNPFAEGPGNQRVVDAVRRLTDQANRASVVIYTMDSRGLQPLNMSAEDSATNLSPAQVRQQIGSRRDDLLFKQQDLAYLAEQTGGFAVVNRNDLGAGIKRVLDDQKGYYLIGYRPDESTFDPVNGRRSFHKLKIKVTGRPGLKVRYRTGFYGVPDSEVRPELLHTRGQQLINALASPFAANGVNLRLTSLFGNDVRTGSFIRSLLYIDGRDLTFKEEPDGWHKSVFDVLAVTFDDNGQIVDQISRTHTLRARGPGYERVLKNGFVYLINLPVKQAGAYQLRAALRDTASERVGSANQFIEVPNLTKNNLTLSGIVVGGEDATAAAAKNNSEASAAAMSGAVSPLTPVADSNAIDDTAQADPQAGPAVRRFVRGMVMQYGFVVYNARVDNVTARPQLQTRMRLFRDGRPVFNGNPKPLNIGAQSDLKRLIASGALRLGTDMTPGEYVLQVIVTDMLAKDKKRTATQWIDFDIVK